MTDKTKSKPKKQASESTSNATDHEDTMQQEKFKMPNFDHESVMASHQKNLETLNEANRMATDVMKSIATLQGQFLRQAFQDMNTFIKDAVGQKLKPEDQAEKVKSAVARAMEHSSNVANIMLKSNQDLFSSVQNRFKDGMEEMETQAKKTTKKPTKH